jgi:hypothetical protein
MRRPRAVVVTSLTLVLGGCASVGEVSIVSSRPLADTSADSEPADGATTATPSTTVGEAPTTTAPSSLPLVDIDLADVMDIGRLAGLTDDDPLLAAAIADIDEWAAEVLLGSYGIDDAPLTGGIHAGHPGREDAIPGCGESETDPDDLREYVALYCRGADFVAVDASPDGLLGDLVDEHGPLTIAVVIAHEYGHAIQERIGALDLALPTVVTEQQADCLTGAWLGRASDGTSSLLRAGPDAVRAGLIALVNVRDPLGVATTTPGGHGTAFDRVGAFQDGFDGGAPACVPLLEEPRELMPNEFTSLDDYLRGGDAPYDCTFDRDPECVPSWEFLGADLDEFWSLATDSTVTVLPSPGPPTSGAVRECPDAVVIDGAIEVCPLDSTVRFDESVVRPLYDEVGDFALGYLLGAAWTELVIAPGSVGAEEGSTELLRDCLVGVWVADITTGRRRDPRRSSTVVTSPGDLDEAIITILTLDGEGGADSVDRISAFRSGVLGGFEACA